MKKVIYGITPARKETSLSPIGLEGAPVSAVAYKGLSCLLSDYTGAEFASLPKEELLGCFLQHQAAVEAMTWEGAILPVKFGPLLGSEEEVLSLLRQGYVRFVQALSFVRDKIEEEVAVTWDIRRVLGELAAEESRLARLSPGPEGIAWPGLQSQEVKEAMKRRREGYRQMVTGFLKDAALDLQPSFLSSDELVTNIAFLLSRSRLEDFEQKVKELVEIFHRDLNFQVVGPLPPYRFTTVEVVREDPARAEGTRWLLAPGAGGWHITIGKAGQVISFS